MKRRSILLLALLPCVLAAAPPPQAGPPGEPASAGLQTTVVSGNPHRYGGMYVLRLEAPAGYRFARHWHPSDEHVTVLQGDLTLEVGRHSTTLGPGDRYLLLGEVKHAAHTTGGAVVQIHGAGPFATTYADPAHDPQQGAGIVVAAQGD